MNSLGGKLNNKKKKNAFKVHENSRMLLKQAKKDQKERK